MWCEGVKKKIILSYETENAIRNGYSNNQQYHRMFIRSEALLIESPDFQ